MDITQDIKDAIAKNLPSAVGDELQKALTQGKADAVIVAKLTADVEQLNTKIVGLMRDVSERDATIATHAALAVREKAVAERESAITVRELQQELAAEKRISAHGLDITSRLVRNLDYRSSVMSSSSVPMVIPGSNGSCGFTQVHETRQTDNKTSTAE